MVNDFNALKKDESPAFRHSLPIQMRFNDVDILGHINNSVYFGYFDLGKSAYFTTIKKGSLDWTKVDVVIANVNCNFSCSHFPCGASIGYYGGWGKLSTEFHDAPAYRQYRYRRDKKRMCNHYG